MPTVQSRLCGGLQTPRRAVPFFFSPVPTVAPSHFNPPNPELPTKPVEGRVATYKLSKRDCQRELNQKNGPIDAAKSKSRKYQIIKLEI